MRYVASAMIVAVIASAERLKSVLLILHRDLNLALVFQSQTFEESSMLTMQNDRGRKKMLTNVRSFTFSPSLVDARLSITALALKSCYE
jgi:hypothetical protein